MCAVTCCATSSAVAVAGSAGVATGTVAVANEDEATAPAVGSGPIAPVAAPALRQSRSSASYTLGPTDVRNYGTERGARAVASPIGWRNSSRNRRRFSSPVGPSGADAVRGAAGPEATAPPLQTAGFALAFCPKSGRWPLWR